MTFICLNTDMAKPSATDLFPPISHPASGVPLYRKVKRAIIQVIEQGRLNAGDALPSEAEISQAFGISIGTLRHAVDELVAEQIVVRRQGRGTFVVMHNAERFLFHYFHVESATGVREFPQVELLSFDRGRMDEEQAEALLGRVGDPVVVVENRLRLQGRPVIHDTLVLPAMLFKGLTEKRFRERPNTIYHLYQTEFGITVVRAHERARAVAADRAAARILGVSVGMPVMEVRRIALTFGDRPVEFRTSVIATSQHDYVHVLARAK
jgi:GntR family transcriptional regulator